MAKNTGFQPRLTFMFRSRELARIAHVVAGGQSVLLVGIRNTGKTQLMKAALTAHAARGGQNCAAFIDVQNLFDLETFYRHLLAGLPKPLVRRAVDLLASARQVPDAMMQWLRKHVDEAEGFGFSVNLNDPAQIVRYWEPLQLALERAVGETSAEALPLLGIDELPFMLENLIEHQVKVAEITVMLAGLRKLRAAGLRMILGGSISMENLLTLNGIPHTVLGQLWREEVPPFTRDESSAFLRHRLAMSPAAAHVDLVLDLLPDWVPSHLETAITMLIDADTIVTAEAVRWQVQHQVLPRISAEFLKQFDERLGKHFPGEDLAVAERLLDQVAGHAEAGGRIDSTALPQVWRRVLTRLQYDMFLRDAPDLGYRFSMNLLRNWWRAQRGMA